MNDTASTSLRNVVGSNVGVSDFGYLRDHAVQDVAVLPGCALISFVAEASSKDRLGPLWLKGIKFHNVCYFPESGIQTIYSAYEHAGQDDISFQSFTTSDSDGERILHASGVIAQPPGEGHRRLPAATEIEDIRSNAGEAIAGDAFYERLQRDGNHYGPAFQGIEMMHIKPGEALACIKTEISAKSSSAAVDVHPAVLDSCLQALAGASPFEGRTFVLQSIDVLCVHGPLRRTRWSHAQVTGESRGRGTELDSVLGDVRVYNDAGQLILEALGVHLQYHDYDRTGAASDRLFAISATFTAEPIETCLKFWTKRLGIPGRIAFAPYNQVFQQLLDPGSLLASNSRGANVILLRVEDWLRFRKELTPRVDPDLQEELLAGKDTHQLPGGPRVAHIAAYETEYLFKEIFTDRAYLRHGVALRDGDCVFDVGANIGLFSIFVESQCRNARIFAFEPSPAAYDCLVPNLSLYCSNATGLNCGLSDSDRELPFTFYPRSSVFSSYHPDLAQDFEAVRAVVRNMLLAAGAELGEETEADVDEFMEGRLASQTVQCRFRSLSSVMREYDVEQIDLLKIDVEKAELDVLRGIQEADWPKIKQVVLEVHDAEGDVLAEVRQILRKAGYQVAVENEDLLEGSGLYNVFASREDTKETVGSASTATRKELEILRKHAEELIQAVTAAAEKSNVPILLALLSSSPQRLAENEARSVDQTIHKLIADELRSLGNVNVISADDIDRLHPAAEFYDAHGDQMGHVPYTAEYFAAVSTAVARRLSALTRTPAKVIVLDCDNTLWSGVCGEVGPEGVDVGDPYEALQRFMVCRHDEGMLLCLCSKNNEEDVRAVFRQRPEMPLREEHIVASRINWRSKSDNIADLSRELNLGLDSFVFLDDNPVECAEVRANLPEVLTLQLPPPAHVLDFLDHVWAFDRLRTTAEDRTRTESYRLNVVRERARSAAPSFREFLNELQLEVAIAPPKQDEFARVAQLSQRTNQFNFTTRRWSEAEIRALASQEHVEVLAAHVRDRFGDYGLVGLTIARFDGQAADVDTFLLSCRVLGRGVEHRMLSRLGEAAYRRELPEVRLNWLATEKNRPAFDFLQSVSNETLEKADRAVTVCLPADQLRGLRYEPNEQSPSEADRRAADTPIPKEDAELPRRSAADHVLFEEIASDLHKPDLVLARARTAERKRRPERLRDFVEPRSDREKAIARIWEEVLGIGQVGVRDNFFEIGGTSLMAVQVVSKLRRELAVNLPVVTLFDRTTVQELAALIDRDHESAQIGESVKSSWLRGAERRSRRKARLKAK